jgi:translation initiation factor eIF-2B subunit gamma
MSYLVVLLNMPTLKPYILLLFTSGHRTILQDVLEQKEAYRSIRLEVLPYLVRSQLVCSCFITCKHATLPSEGVFNCCKHEQRSTPSGGSGTSVDEIESSAFQSSGNLQCLSQHRVIAPSAFKQDVLSRSSGGHRCCAYIASKSKYCHRLNSIQSYCDINRDVRISLYRDLFCHMHHYQIMIKLLLFYISGYRGS